MSNNILVFKKRPDHYRWCRDEDTEKIRIDAKDILYINENCEDGVFIVLKDKTLVYINDPIKDIAEVPLKNGLEWTKHYWQEAALAHRPWGGCCVDTLTRCKLTINKKPILKNEAALLSRLMNSAKGY